MTDSIQQALAVLQAMKESQPGAHVTVLEEGFHALWDGYVGASITQKLVKAELKNIVDQLYANIPLGQPDPVFDPNDEFKRCAVDRAERVREWSSKLNKIIDPKSKLTPAEWSIAFGVAIKDPDGWQGEYEKSLDEPITRAEFSSRLSLSTITVHNWSILK